MLSEEIEDAVQSVVVAIMALVLVVVLGFAVVDVIHTETRYDCTVTEKFIKQPDRSPMVRTSCGLFEVLNSALDRDSDGSVRFNQINVGDTYTFTTRGYYADWIQVYPNITALQKEES